MLKVGMLLTHNTTLNIFVAIVIESRPIITKAKDSFGHGKAAKMSATNSVMDLLDGMGDLRTGETSKEDAIKATFIKESPHNYITRNAFKKSAFSVTSKVRWENRGCKVVVELVILGIL
jgi:hypothetical protein